MPISRPSGQYARVIDVSNPAHDAGCVLRLHRERSRWTDRFRKYIVEVDASDVGKIGNDSTATFELSPGEHRLRLRIDWTGSKTISFRAEPGETVDFVCRAAVRPSQGFRIAMRAISDRSVEWIALERSA